ncbi:MAG: Hsp20/alpha crystallin family protein [Nitrospira sp.]|nr:Hsp20/alpha crystallin family protein [Nitrospira sp.]
MNSYVPSALTSIQTDRFDHQIDQLLDEAVRAFSTSNPLWAPASNAWEDDNGFYVQLALPGWEPSNIALEVNNQVLTVKGERNIQTSESEKYHLREIADGRFTRLFRLPTFVDHDKASATHRQGLLTISFPKREEAKPRQIMIEGS